ncbi:MAG: glycoside hydrolase family 9 protein [Candidatus Sulfotelmatobacter sp.]|jgi:endoglucanase
MTHTSPPQILRRPRSSAVSIISFLLLACASAAASSSAYVRVNQIGYESNDTPFQAYLMSTASESGATFNVVNSEGQTVYSSPIGALLGTWSNSAKLVYDVYALSFSVPGGNLYTISVQGPVPATSPQFAVDDPAVLYPGLLLNTLWFYETDRDGPNYISNALRSAPGHLNDENTTVDDTPPLNNNDLITTTGTPLTPTGAVINGAGGWWDAGDYMKYVETVSYTTALMEIGARDFPNQIGPNAPQNPAPPPASVSYAGTASGAPASSDFSAEAQFGIAWLMQMWDDSSKTLYYQVDNSQDWKHFPNLESEYDVWTLPQAADDYRNCTADYFYICYRPGFIAAPAGSPISPNLAGRMAAAFAEYYQLYQTTDPTTAAQALQNAEDIFALANTSLADPARSVDDGSCASGCLLTITPFDGYPETVWDDDMELGATELYFALATAQGSLPTGLPVTNPSTYLADAAHYASNYITRIYDTGDEDTLNLYDVSGLAHFELYRALGMAGNPGGLAVNQSTMLTALKNQLGVAITQSAADVWGFGVPWQYGDTTSHGAGLSVMASELYDLTTSSSYNTYAQKWLGNILGANSWGSSFIVGDGSTFPNCIQHQVANLAGALDGTSGGTPILWGAASEGPSSAATSGTLPGMILCPANGTDTFKVFNGNDGKYNSSNTAVYRDNVQSYSTTEPGIDLTSTSFLMFSWRLAGHPSFWTSSAISAHPQTIFHDSHNSSTWLTATVKGTGSVGPHGRARFYLGSTSGTLLGEASLQDCSDAASTATLKVRASDLASGVNDIIVYFSGDNKNGPSTSLPVEVTVNP